MGRIKHTYLKNVAEKLLSERKDDFADKFDQNKKLVSEHTTVQSKTVRNRIAGYITRVVRRQKSNK